MHACKIRALGKSDLTFKVNRNNESNTQYLSKFEAHHTLCSQKQKAFMYENISIQISKCSTSDESQTCKHSSTNRRLSCMKTSQSKYQNVQPLMNLKPASTQVQTVIWSIQLLVEDVQLSSKVIASVSPRNAKSYHINFAAKFCSCKVCLHMTSQGI